MTGKYFSDNIYNLIYLPPNAIKIIDTPTFQRLDSIKQLGPLSFVYPQANHTRKEHCLGNAHLAKIWYDHLFRYPEENDES